LGFCSEQYEQLQVLKKRPTGMIIISGPTGSGKSTTLQRALKSYIRETEGKKHVLTVEDPPEYTILGAVQTPVANAGTEQERASAFQKSIKAAMRLDPDVIMIGEMRDAPSAKLALQAAMTGHQVWSTLHANGAFHIITRLVDMGLDIKMISDPLITAGLVSQRLLRKLCPHCKRPLMRPDVLEELQSKDPSFRTHFNRFSSVLDLDSVFVLGHGCNAPGCYKGVTGMTVAAEVVVTDTQLMEYIKNYQLVAALKYWKENLGGVSMVDHALSKVRSGLVDPFDAENAVGHLDDGALAARPFYDRPAQ
jgi:general secretion pathway protein E